jgi:LacI family transcriptional regulator
MTRESQVRPRSAVGVRDIARRLGVSVGTVDRALHGKPDVKPDTRARVLAAARTLGYRPNLAASYLRSGRQRRIAVHVPDRLALFWDTLRDGIREAAAPFAPSLGVDFRAEAGPRLALQALPFDRSIAGLIVARGDSAGVTSWLDDAGRRNAPVACVAEVVDDPRVLAVYVDPFSVGALAGELIGRCLPSGGHVAMVTPGVATRADAQRTSGFVSSLSQFTTRLKLAAVVQSHHDERETRRRVFEMLRAHPRVKGLFVSTAQAMPVLEVARQEGRLPALAVVTSDLSRELFDWIRDGAVAATIYERPLTQGRAAFRLLHQYLQTMTPIPPHRHVIAPYAVMRSNLELVLQRLEDARAASLLPRDAAAAAP